MALDPDLELMVRVQSGDADSFRDLLGRHRGPLVNFFWRMLGDHETAEDLAQEVFLRVYQARERYRPEARFTTWLYRIATNLALNARRDRKQADPLPGEDDDGPQVRDGKPSVEDEMMRRDRARVIRQAIESLPEKQRVAVILHKYQEQDYRQIARVLDLSESAVKSLLFRAYENLRGRLEPLLTAGKI